MSQTSNAAEGTATPALPSLTPRVSKAVACAECRRLKLKCTRNFPCVSCRRRGVADLCPDGSLITRSRITRETVASQERLKLDRYRLVQRIKKLEEALATVQSQVSDEPHPLLVDPFETCPLPSMSYDSSENDPAQQ